MRASTATAAGDYLRTWRRRRRLSQLEFALDADISQRHLSFLESGRSVPSRDMLLHLAERLEVPLRDRNAMLLAAGYAPVFAERSLDDPAMASVRHAVDRVLRGHEPFPALAVDGHWTLIAANTSVNVLLAGVNDPALLTPPVNVLRVSLHPRGLAPRIVNLAEWRAHLLDRLRHQCAATGDPSLVELLRELSSYPAGSHHAVPGSARHGDHGDVFGPLHLMTDAGLASFISTTMLFGAPRDITLSELAVEAFFPADAETTAVLRRLAPG